MENEATTSLSGRQHRVPRAARKLEKAVQSAYGHGFRAGRETARLPPSLRTLGGHGAAGSWFRGAFRAAAAVIRAYSGTWTGTSSAGRALPSSRAGSSR
jgi:hypothetical protein